VLAAPLLRWSLYEQSKGTFAIYSRFTSRIPRFFQKNSSDKDFLVFNRTADYLHLRHLSLKWVKALFDWNEMIEKAEACSRPALVLQGDADKTVQWEHNVSVVREKLPGARIELIEGARHELFNESTQYREKTLKIIERYFENGTL
jgi:alpha-beta hydrolase superfamily lysophospholipase